MNIVKLLLKAGLLVILAIGLSFYIINTSVFAQSKTYLVWRTKASMVSPKALFGLVTEEDGKIYSIGGQISSDRADTPTDEVYMYDPISDLWTRKSSLPHPLFDMGTTVGKNGKIYVIGGITSDGPGRTNYLTNRVEEYDPLTDSWADRASMPTPRYGVAVATATNGKIYAIGGANQSGIVSTVEEYDPETDTWASRTSMRTFRYELAAIATGDGNIYAFGGIAPQGPGYPSDNSPMTVEMYNPSSDTWINKANIAVQSGGLGATLAPNGKIYAIGGDGGGQVTEVQEYDPATDIWIRLSSIPLPRLYDRVATSGGKIYLMGGLSETDWTTLLNTVNEGVFDTSPPIVGKITAPTAPIVIGTDITASANFTDEDPKTFSAIWDWGDGSTSNGTIVGADNGGIISGNHVYNTSGVFTISLKVIEDQAGDGISPPFEYIVVYDPNGGYVTGSGTIESPAGAFTADISITGKATFGFTSKYQHGANIPSGTTQFKFNVAKFTFKSISYDWLTVGGAKAQYKGTGTVNGSGNYGFLLSAVDGKVNGNGGTDMFRIKIWDKLTNDIVYDNEIGSSDGSDPSTSLTSGSIVIHP